MTKRKVKTTWDLSTLASGNNDPKFDKNRKLSKRSYEAFEKKWRARSDYLKDPTAMKEALDDYNRLNGPESPHVSENYYFQLKSSLDQGNPKLKAKLAKIDEFSVKLANTIQFFELAIGKIDKTTQKILLESKELADYKHFLSKIFKIAKYRLTEPEEKILLLKSETSHSRWVRMVSMFLSKEERDVLDEKGERNIKSFSEILSLMNNKDKKIRDTAAKAFNEIMSKHVDVATEELNAILSNKKINDELRKIKRPDLGRHLADDIDSEVVDALVESVTKRNNIAHRYYKLKAKLLGLPKLEYHERNVEYGSLNQKYSFEDSRNLVSETFKNLDPAFISIFKNYMEEGKLDVFPKKGKTSGAFCAGGSIKSLPTFILINHTEELGSVLTLAHEAGHGIQNELMRQSQNELNFGAPLSTAEVASTFFEDFVLEELVKNSDNETKLSIMMKKLNDDISTIFRQIALYKFEQEIHPLLRSAGYLPKGEIGKLFQKHMSSYMGPAVEQSAGSENWWVYWSHIRRFFYVYSYASGLLISKSMQKRVREQPTFISKVKDFLSAGESDSPKNLFLKMDIDISKKSFWQEGLTEIGALLEETESLAIKLRKI